MAAIKALDFQSISNVVRVSESSENTYNLECSDESSCNSDVNILDFLISETTREPENSFRVKDNKRTADCQVDNLTIPPTLYHHSSDNCKYYSNIDLETQVVEMPPTVNFDIHDLNCLNLLSSKENLTVSDNAIDDLLSSLTIDEQKTCIKSSKDSIKSNLVNFLEKPDVKYEGTDDSRNEVSIGSGQQKSRDSAQVSLSLATLAQHHFQENQFDSILESKNMPDKEEMKEYSVSFNNSKNEVKELIPHDEDMGISLSALAESYLRSENVSNCIPSHALLGKNDSEQTCDLDILSFISSVDGAREDIVKLTNCCKEKLNSAVKEIKNSVFTELLETKRGSDEGCDCDKLSPEADSNCVSLQQTLLKKNSSEIEDLDILSFINSVNVIENDGVKLANCSRETLTLDVKGNENFDKLLATEESSDEGYDSGKLSPGIDLNNCIKRPATPSPIFKSSVPNVDCSVLQLQDDSGNLGLVYVSTAKAVNTNLLHAMPKPSLVNTKQSLFAKVLSCQYKQQNEKTLEKVSDIKRKLFEKYFCKTEQDILCEVPNGKKKLFDKSTDSVITSGYLHFSALPSDSC